jgi:hypothetical protein
MRVTDGPWTLIAVRAVASAATRCGRLGAAGLLLGAAACGPPAPVVQGKVLAFDAAVNRLVVQDETRPDTAPVSLDISHADIGTTPRVGDRVRVVYRAADRTARALAVMNLERSESSPVRR